MSSSDVSIRDANLADIPSITSIYAHAVINTVATLDTEEPTIATQEEWFRHHDERHPVLVAESGNTVVGWASLSDWSTKAGYRNTAEASVYVSPECHRQGIGTELLQALVERAQSVGLHVLVARISSTNETSLRLARRCGFSHVGTMNESGFKFGNYVDVEVLQLVLHAARG
ncbi:MAG: N-acetyltransferase family protein [Dehalococcoidia bacterium]|nr:MAG: N-acetyltransferase family protein [Dehalococcoidia bacterium]